MGHRIIEINGESVVATSHQHIVELLATTVGEVRAMCCSCVCISCNNWKVIRVWCFRSAVLKTINNSREQGKLLI